MIRDIRNHFEHKVESYYKPVGVGNFWSNNYIENKIKGDRSTLSVEEHLNEIKPYLKEIINDLKKSDTCRIQLTMTIIFNFISFKYDNDEENLMHSKNDNTEVISFKKKIISFKNKK